MQNRRNRRPKKGMQRRQPSRQEGTSCNIVKRINIFGILELPDDVMSNGSSSQSDHNSTNLLI